MATIRDLEEGEKDPEYQLAIFGMQSNSPEVQILKDVAAETFEWPWAKVSEDSRLLLESLRPNRILSQLAAWEYLDSSSRRINCTSIWSPLFILGLAAIGLAVMGLAFGRG